MAPYSDVNLFLESEIREDVPGLLLSIPADWELVSGVKRSAKGDYVTLRSERTKDGKFRVFGRLAIQQNDVILLQLTSGLMDKPYRVSVSPIANAKSSSIGRIASDMDVQPQKRPRKALVQNHVGVFSERDTDGFTIDLPAESHLKYAEPYTVSMWAKTTEVNEVILSTWSGNQADDYPLEWVVDPAGYLEFYRGYNSKHVSLRSSKPISDGHWHFVALVHDPVGEWTKLAIDGEVVDSLYHVFSFPNRNATRLALGSRLNQETSIETDNFSGQMDDLRISSFVWDQATIDAEMRRPSRESGFLLDFELPISPSLVTTTSQVDYGQADLDVVINVVDNLVVLEWDIHDALVQSFIVERSIDGLNFEPIAEVLSIPLNGASESLSYTDVIQPEGVVYYRLVPRFEYGFGNVSQTLKLGLGEPGPTFTAALKGNYPNPFNPSTTIEYEVLETQRVRISVWDLSGQMVTTLEDGTKSAGRYEVPFVATDLPSGTYFVRLESDAGIQSHQMLLMK